MSHSREETELLRLAGMVAYCQCGPNKNVKYPMLVTDNPQRVAKIATLAVVLATTMVTVSTIYWPQAMLEQMRTDLAEPTMVSLLPGATLLGYAAGVTMLAVASKNLAARRVLVCHMAVLIVGVVALAVAPTGMAAVAACLLVGSGCALTQRLLIIATSTQRPERRAEVIGLVVASGLAGIVVARAWMGEVAQNIGWRHTLILNAVLMIMMVFALLTVPWPKLTDPVRRPISALGLWKRYPTLRLAAIHQAVVFAAFNAGWAILPMLTTTTSATRAIVAGVGAMTAIFAGQTRRLCRPDRLTVIAPLLIAVAAVLVTLVASRLAAIGAMILIEIGTQLALVANQTRAQAIAPDVGSRGRMASLVTAIGFVGGALGAAAANIFIR